MASNNQPNHPQCEFLDTVNDLFFCKKCNLVARRLTATSCCGESFCHVCIADICEQHKPCPECGQEDFSIYEQFKYQKRIGSLKVHCSFKSRGCGWSGQLDQLEHHLDSEQGDCQYVDIKCPLNCQQVVPKNQVEQHLSEACTKRPYVCHHCAFKAPYEEVVEKHLPECKYVPLPCPNRCGVTCDREDMEDHMKMCRLEEMVCKFSGIGCDGGYVREDEDEYTEKNTQKHLVLIAADAMETKQQLQKKLYEQEQKLREQEQKLGDQVDKQEQKLREWEQKCVEQEQTIQDLELKLEEQSKKLDLLQQDLNTKGQLLDKVTSEQLLNSTRTFEMRNFSVEKAKDKPGDWKSPGIRTHLHGYKFCIGVDANGEKGFARGRGISVHLYTMAGEYDEDLKWPVEARFTVGLISQSRQRNEEYSKKVRWDRPKTQYQVVATFGEQNLFSINSYLPFIHRSALSDFLINDNLHFYVKEVRID